MLVRTLIQKSSITSEDVVLDIGAGKGIITKELADHCKRVEAIEKDPVLCERLRQRFAGRTNINIRCCDFMDYSLPLSPYKIFANIPYVRTADILRKLLDAGNPPETTYLVIQREAAHKYAGAPYRAEMLASLTHKPWFDFQILHVFKPTDFNPIPRVTSVLLGIEKRPQPLVSAEQKDLYLDFVVYGFTANKLNLCKAYNHIFGYEHFKRRASDLDFNIYAKPTDLNFKQWLGLFLYFAASIPEDKKQRVKGAWARLNAQQQKLVKRHKSII